MQQNTDAREQHPPTSNGTYELAYLETKMRASRKEVQAAIAAVGADRVKVSQFLRKNRSR